MAWIEAHTEMDATQPLREAITLVAAAGFFAGGSARHALSGTTAAPMFAMLYLPLGALAAALVAGIAVNLIALPMLTRIVPGHRLPTGAYRAAGAFSALAAYGAASPDRSRCTDDRREPFAGRQRYRMGAIVG